MESLIGKDYFVKIVRTLRRLINTPYSLWFSNIDHSGKMSKNYIVGANAVVTKDIPDYSVAVGIPAKVIKRYNFENNTREIVK